MLIKRLLVAIPLIPIGLLAIYYGGYYYIAIVTLLLSIAAWEYVQLFRRGGGRPAMVVVVAGTVFLVLGRVVWGFTQAPTLLSGILLVSMVYHLVDFERGRQEAGSDFALTIAGVFYLGWLGAYLISLRDLEGGVWWVLTALPSVWIADSGAYFIGKGFGRHPLSPRLSPKKTWEGYLGGVIVGTVGTALLTALWRIGAGSVLTPVRGAILGFILAVLTPLGDLGESMFKRQVGVKDSSNLIPGHGGAFDRIDSWLWSGVLAYYVIHFLWV
ncbi:MAG: phosphatidate cytidylyltransferase [Chloroflexota bacterium]